MAEATITFTLPDESTEFQTAVDSSAMAAAIFDIRNHVFRPARKHGYEDRRIQELLEKLGSDGEDLVEHLERLFGEILDGYGVSKYS